MAALLAVASMVAIVALARTTAVLPRAVGTLVIVSGPGLAWAPLIQIRDRALEAMVAILISVTAVILIAQAVTYAASFSWRPCEFILVTVTALGLFVQALVALLASPVAGHQETSPAGGLDASARGDEEGSP